MMTLYCIYEKVGTTSALVFRKVLLLENCGGLIVIFPVSVYPHLSAASDTCQTSQDRAWCEDRTPSLGVDSGPIPASVAHVWCIGVLDSLRDGLANLLHCAVGW